MIAGVVKGQTVLFYNGRNGKYNIHDPDSIYNICVYHIHVQYQDIRDNCKSTICNLAVISGMTEVQKMSRSLIPILCIFITAADSDGCGVQVRR